MSVMGTGIAAGVAQTAHNAQQIARQQDKKARDDARASREVRDRYEHLIQDLEEGDDANTAARLAVDDQVPDHQQSHIPDTDDQDHERKPAPSPLADLAERPDAVALRQQLLGHQQPQGLFRHLDVEA